MHREAIQHIIELLERRPKNVDAEERLRIAAGALLVECARVDASYSDDDRGAVAAAVIQLFGLGSEVADVLVAIAEKRAVDVWHDWILTKAVKRGFDAQERRLLVHKLWKVAVANGVVEPREESFVRRIARELGVSDAEVDAARPDAAATQPEPGGASA
jgi:uncharacterized tellurite resistance protein B-like protein